MRYVIEGADLRTGMDRSLTVDADDPREAEEMARELDLMVAMVRPSEDEVILDELVAAIADRKPEALSYAAPRVPLITTDHRPPAYHGLCWASKVMLIFAILNYALGAILLLIGLVELGIAIIRSFDISAVFIFATLLPGLALLMAGALLHGASTACLALRDIAQNTFRALPHSAS